MAWWAEVQESRSCRPAPAPRVGRTEDSGIDRPPQAFRHARPGAGSGPRTAPANDDARPGPPKKREARGVFLHRWPVAGRRPGMRRGAPTSVLVGDDVPIWVLPAGKGRRGGAAVAPPRRADRWLQRPRRRGGRRRRTEPDDRRRATPQGGPRPHRPLAALGTVPGRAAVGDGARGLQPRRDGLGVLPSRPGSVARLPLGRGRPRRHLRQPPAARASRSRCGTGATPS